MKPINPNNPSTGSPGREIAGGQDVSHSLSSQRRVGRFDVRKQVSQMESCEECVGWDARFDREVILKIFPPTAFATRAHQLSFQEQIRACRILSHPSIVSIVGFGRVELSSFVAYERRSGILLDAWLEGQNEPVGPDFAAVLVQYLADAVQHAHQRDLYHGNLNLANIQIEPRDDPKCQWEAVQVRILNYGMFLSTLTDHVSVAATRSESVLEGGSPGPVMDDFRWGVATDIRSLGGILFRLLAGREVPSDWDQKNSQERKQQTLSGESGLDAICLKCLEPCSSDRYQTAFELADELIHWQASAGRSRQSPSFLRFLPWSR